jgi:hypothetical protein
MEAETAPTAGQQTRDTISCCELKHKHKIETTAVRQTAVRDMNE